MKKSFWIVLAASLAVYPGASWADDDDAKSMWGIDDAYCTMFGTCGGGNANPAPAPQQGGTPQAAPASTGGDQGGGSMWGSGGGDNGDTGGGSVWGNGKDE